MQPFQGSMFQRVYLEFLVGCSGEFIEITFCRSFGLAICWGSLATLVINQLSELGGPLVPPSMFCVGCSGCPEALSSRKIHWAMTTTVDLVGDPKQMMIWLKRPFHKRVISNIDGQHYSYIYQPVMIDIDVMKLVVALVMTKLNDPARGPHCL